MKTATETAVKTKCNTRNLIHALDVLKCIYSSEAGRNITAIQFEDGTGNRFNYQINAESKWRFIDLTNSPVYKAVFTTCTTMKTVTVFLLCLLSLASCNNEVESIRFNECIAVFDAGDAGCELCEWISENDYYVLNPVVRDDSSITVMLYSTEYSEYFALDYLTAEQYQYVDMQSKPY